MEQPTVDLVILILTSNPLLDLVRCTIFKAHQCTDWKDVRENATDTDRQRRTSPIDRLLTKPIESKYIEHIWATGKYQTRFICPTPSTSALDSTSPVGLHGMA